MAFDEGTYWEERYRTRGVAAVGTASGTDVPGGGGRLNSSLYRLRAEAWDRLLESQNIALSDRRVLDVGCGSGFWTQYFTERGAGRYQGIDISETAVASLAERYPQHRFDVADIGGSHDLPLDGPYHIINVFDVLYHVVDDAKFERAIANLARHVGERLVIVDFFPPEPVPNTAAHVRFRTLEHYRRALESNGLRIDRVDPIFYLLGRSVGLFSKDPVTSWLANLALWPFYFRGYLAPVLYHVDRKLVRLVDPLSVGARAKLLVAVPTERRRDTKT